MKKTLLFVALVAVGASLYWFSGPPPPPPDGPFESYQDNGQLEWKGTYKDGVEDGPVEEYYDNGQLYEKGSYKDGEPCGEWFEGETLTYDPC